MNLCLAVRDHIACHSSNRRHNGTGSRVVIDVDGWKEQFHIENVRLCVHMGSNKALGTKIKNEPMNTRVLKLWHWSITITLLVDERLFRTQYRSHSRPIVLKF